MKNISALREPAHDNNYNQKKEPESIRGVGQPLGSISNTALFFPLQNFSENPFDGIFDNSFYLFPAKPDHRTYSSKQGTLL